MMTQRSIVVAGVVVAFVVTGGCGSSNESSGGNSATGGSTAASAGGPGAGGVSGKTSGGAATGGSSGSVTTGGTESASGGASGKGGGGGGAATGGSGGAVSAGGTVSGSGGAATAGEAGASGAAPGGSLWHGIIDPSRAADWTHAGVVGGIPTRTTLCATLNPGVTAAAINDAIQACPAGQVVMLSAGTYNLSDDGIVMKSGVTLRGAGADQTLLVFSATTYCNNQDACICFAGSNEWGGDARALPGGSNYADWTGGYAQGSTQITLENVGSAIAVGQSIHLDQANDQSVGADFFVCDNTTAPCSLEGGNGGRTIDGLLRSQVQIVKVTAVNGDTYTIDPPLYSPNWRAGQKPAAWWPSTLLENAGVEELSVDATASGGMTNVSMVNAANDWVEGVRLVRTCECQRDLVQLEDSSHCTIESNYLFGTQGKSVNYGIESYVASDDLVANNILQHVVAPMMVQPALGSVFAYNYAINDTYDDGFASNPLHWMIGMADQHNAGVEYNLYEGNIGPGAGGDVIHGNQLANTLFRNWFLGSDPGRTDATIAVTLSSYNRYHNVVGNVLGTPGYTTTYEVNSGIGQSGVVYDIGSGDTEGSVTVPDDPLVSTTLFRWGNFDVATNKAHFDASDVPSDIGSLANPVPASQSLPASFYLTEQPDFWPASKPWPPIGPDVAGGTVSGLAGHVFANPAMDCYTNVMKGPADGTGTPLTFNRAACYP
ncbi:MAG TPA: hypothetical protein VMI54_00940 [Polyangiaceae bacterium]|nr:hypothetical protein [Polyangiaceae bacterium]